jgi:hypothetical protein
MKGQKTVHLSVLTGKFHAMYILPHFKKDFHQNSEHSESYKD